MTDAALNAGAQANISPNLILEIEGYSRRFGSLEIFKYIRIGDPDLYIGDDWIIGGFRLIDDQAPYISFNTGTTTRITQKLDPARAQGSSVSQMVISLVDKNEEVSQLISPGIILPEIMGKRVIVYSGYQGTGFPEDYIIVFRGIIQTIESGCGFVNLICNATDEKKRQTILNRNQSEVIGKIHYRSTLFQDIFYQNRDDVTNSININYTSGGTAGSEVVTVVGTNISVQIQSGVSKAKQIKKAVENHPDANQLVTLRIEGDSEAAQTTGSASLFIANSVALSTVADFFSPFSPTFRTYVKINDELCEYTSILGNTLMGVTRGELNSVAEIHNDGSTVDQVYRLIGNGLDLALKLMLSQGPIFYRQNIEVLSINRVDVSTVIPNAIFFDIYDLQAVFGIVAGDLITVTGSGIGGNNVVDAQILDYGTYLNYSYIVIDQTLTEEIPSPALCSFKSKYNVLPLGLGMTPDEVDVLQHEFIRDTFLPVFDLDIYFTDTGGGRDFIEREIYLPMACFSVPRKGRSSVNYHTGPIATYDVVTLNNENVENANTLRVGRSTSDQFFNTVTFKYDYNPVSGDYETVRTFKDQTAIDKVNLGQRELLIQSKALRTTSGATVQTEEIASRFLARYSLGAFYIKGIKTLGGKTLPVEIGDVAFVDFADMKLTDMTAGNRSGDLKVMEILNKVIDSKTGEIALDVVNTIYKAYDRYAFIAPASLTTVGSNTTKIKVQKLWGTKAWQSESWKWKEFLNQHILVRKADFSTIYQTTLRGFDESTTLGLMVDPIPAAPGEGWIVEPVNYPNTENVKTEALWKARTIFVNPSVKVTTGIDLTKFNVSLSDADYFFVGSILYLHNDDFTDQSEEVEVISITGTQIEISIPITFIPNSSHTIELIGFKDKQPAYRVL